MKNNLLKGTFIYTFSNMLIKLGSLIFLPIMTRILTKEEFGIIGVLAPITSIITTVIGLGIYNAVLKKYVDYKKDIEKLKIYKFSIVSFVFIFNLLIIAIYKLTMGKHFIENLLGIDYNLIFVCILISMVNTFNNIALSIYRIEKKYYKVAFASLLSFITNYILAIYFIKNLKLGVMGNQLANLIAVSVLLIYLYIEYFKQITFKIESTFIKSTIIMGIPLIFIELTDQLVNFSDRFILRINKVDFALIGVYALAYTGTRVLHVITNSFTNAWIPELYNSKDKNKANDKFEKYLAVLSLLCVIAILFSNELISLLFTQHYKQAVTYMPLIMTTALLQATYALDFYFHYNEKSKYIIVFTLIALLINITLNVIFIPIFITKAIEVSIITTIISMLVRSLLEMLIIKNKFNVSFNYKRMLLFFIIVLNPLISYISTGEIGYMNFLLKIAYLLIVIYILLDNELIRGIKTWIKRKL